MNFKKISVIFLALLILVLSISAISASEDIQKDLLTNSTSQDLTDVDNSTIENEQHLKTLQKKRLKQTFRQ